MTLKKQELSLETGKRLVIMREHLHYSRPEMARRLGITPNTLGKNENGESFPNAHTLQRLALEFDLSMDWLLFNKGPMFFKEHKQSEELEKEVAELQNELDRVLTPEVKELVEQMEKIPLLHHEMLTHFHRFKMEHKLTHPEQ